MDQPLSRRWLTTETRWPSVCGECHAFRAVGPLWSKVGVEQRTAAEVTDESQRDPLGNRNSSHGALRLGWAELRTHAREPSTPARLATRKSGSSRCQERAWKLPLGSVQMLRNELGRSDTENIRK